MGLLDNIRRDARRFTSNSADFATALMFTSPGEGSVTVTVNGLATKHHFEIDSQGNVVASANVHCCVAEQLLTEEDYPVRVNGKVNLKRHTIAWTDATGEAKSYIIEDWMPDDTLGLIRLRLGALAV